MNTDNEKLQSQKERHEKYRRRYLDRTRANAAKYLQELEALPGEPVEFEYFKNILRKVFIDNEVVKHGDGEILVGTFCQTVPSEIIYAAGARQIRLCSSGYTEAQVGSSVMPRDVCPLTKSVIGNATSEAYEIYKACDMYVVPVSCDCKKMLAKQLANYKTTVPLYIPLNRDDDSGMEAYVREIKKTADKISEMTGVKVTRDGLANQIKIHADVQREIQRFIALKSNNDVLIRGAYALAVMNTLAYDDISNWGRHLKKLNEELTERKNKQEYPIRKKLPRLLLTGSPITFPNIKIPLIAEKQGGIIVADETCMGDRGMSDFVSVCDDSTDGYFRALANRYIRPCSCPVFPDNETRIHKIDNMVKENHIDGIIYHVFRGCLVYDYEFERIERHFGAKGIPAIRLESDCTDEDTEQLRVRIEAFLEMITFKNKGKEGVLRG